MNFSITKNRARNILEKVRADYARYVGKNWGKEKVNTKTKREIQNYTYEAG